jgi:outer membrane immunogenic protein
MMLAQNVGGVRVMIATRLTVSALALLGLVHNVSAADYSEPILRGAEVFAPAPATYFRWSGFYVGGQGGYSHADFTLGNGARAIFDILGDSLPGNPDAAGSVPVVLKDSVGTTSYGGFIGYNWQWENVVIGLEGNYNRTSLKAASAESVPISPPNIGTGTLTSTAHLTDYGTVRARAGYIMGQFMPYAMVGLALGRADFSDSARFQYTPVINGVAQPAVDITSIANQNGAIGYGFAAGAGLDVMLIGGIFLRGEYEFVQLNSFSQAPVLAAVPELESPSRPATFGGVEPFDRKVTLHTVRGAVGFKF